jgi:RNase P/RNase MRP subunit POP5
VPPGKSIYDSLEMSVVFYVPYHNGIVVCVRQRAAAARLAHSFCDAAQVPRVQLQLLGGRYVGVRPLRDFCHKCGRLA